MRKDESRMKDRIKSYVEWMKEHSSFYTHHSSFRYAVDCSNGMASLLVHELFPDAVVINDTLDGTFPNHSPNPLKAEAREQIAALVREQKLDCGVIFDGDADRCMFVDEKGDFVQPDYLIPIVARATLSTSQPLNRTTSFRLRRLRAQPRETSCDVDDARREASGGHLRHLASPWLCSAEEDDGRACGDVRRDGSSAGCASPAARLRRRRHDRPFGQQRCAVV